MEMSPKAIAAVTFPVVRKGYDPEQVRSFLSQLSRGVEELQNRALQAEAKARLSAAPAPAAEPAPNMDSITKTLVMAQRTADATLADAREEADGIRTEASERAESILAEAKAQGAQMIAAAEQEALRTGEITRSKVAAEVEALEARRSALSDDVDSLSTHVTTQREQLASTVLVLNQALEHPGLKDVTKPTLSAPPADPPGPALVPPSDLDTRPPTELMGPSEQPETPDEADRGFPAPQANASAPDPITQEVPLVEQGEPQAWSFFDEGPKGDDRWKK
jgi:DivIVA domain-containing protein